VGWKLWAAPWASRASTRAIQRRPRVVSFTRERALSPSCRSTAGVKCGVGKAPFWAREVWGWVERWERGFGRLAGLQRASERNSGRRLGRQAPASQAPPGLAPPAYVQGSCEFSDGTYGRRERRQRAPNEARRRGVAISVENYGDQRRGLRRNRGVAGRRRPASSGVWKRTLPAPS
jgi:hypothetical protein